MTSENATPASFVQTRLTSTTRARIGRYRVAGLLGRGGMAEVALVVAGEREATSKLLVVKRILEENAADPDFVTMFMDEARLALRLSHPNVVQTFEVDSEEQVPFLTMEYLAGQPLNKVVLSERSQATVMPLAMKLHLVVGWLDGLHYAHTLCDYDGAPLGVVHRDVSPHNLFVTYEGVAKVVDFGIAKAAGRMQQTHAGVGGPKGKVRYMAPEQAKGEQIDGRADVFSMGVVLAELITGQRFWPRGLDDLSILLDLVHDKVPAFEPEVPIADELNELVLRALAPSPAARFATAAEMRAAIEGCAFKLNLRSSNAEVSEWMKRSFAHDRERLQGQIREALARLATEAAPSLSAAPPAVEPVAPEPTLTAPSAPAEPSARTGARAPLLLGVALCAVFFGAFALSKAQKGERDQAQSSPQPPAPPASPASTAPREPPQALSSASSAPSVSGAPVASASARPAAQPAQGAGGPTRPRANTKTSPASGPAPGPAPAQPPPLFLP